MRITSRAFLLMLFSLGTSSWAASPIVTSSEVHKQLVATFCSGALNPDLPGCQFSSDGSLLAIASPDLISIETTPDCNQETLNELLNNYGSLFFPHGDSSSFSNVSIVPVDTLQTEGLKVCVFMQYINGIKLADGKIMIFIDRLGSISAFRMKPFFGPLESAALSLSEDQIRNRVFLYLGEMLGNSALRPEQLLFHGVEPVLKQAGESWEVVWRGDVSVPRSELFGSGAAFSFTIHELDPEIVELSDTSLNSYQWTCPYTTTSISVRHSVLAGGTAVSTMIAVNPNSTRKGNYEMVDYCGTHVYNRDIEEPLCLCGIEPLCVCENCDGIIPVWCLGDHRFSYTRKTTNQFTVASGSQFKEQEAYYWGQWMRQYYLDREDFIDFGDYQHKYNILVNTQDQSVCCSYQDIFIRSESANLPTIKIKTSGEHDDIAHEYTHLVFQVALPDMAGYYIDAVPPDEPYNFGGLQETIAQIGNIIAFTANFYWSSSSDDPFFPWHISPATKTCEVFTEGLANCNCSASRCREGHEDNHRMGDGFLQAYLELYYNRSYTATACSYNYQCSGGICDTQPASHYCYKTVGNYTSEEAEQALWLALQTIENENVDSDPLAFWVAYFLYVYDGYNYSTLTRSRQEFANHQIDAQNL